MFETLAITLPDAVMRLLCARWLRVDPAAVTVIYDATAAPAAEPSSDEGLSKVIATLMCVPAWP